MMAESSAEPLTTMDHVLDAVMHTIVSVCPRKMLDNVTRVGVSFLDNDHNRTVKSDDPVNNVPGSVKTAQVAYAASRTWET